MANVFDRWGQDVDTDVVDRGFMTKCLEQKFKDMYISKALLLLDYNKITISHKSVLYNESIRTFYISIKALDWIRSQGNSVTYPSTINIVGHYKTLPLVRNRDFEYTWIGGLNNRDYTLLGFHT
jgi:hypothetical protein